MEKTIMHHISQMLPSILSLAKQPVWFDYDEEADVLYVSFRKPQDATETVPVDDFVLRRERNGKVVGLTILHASKSAKQRLVS